MNEFTHHIDHPSHNPFSFHYSVVGDSSVSMGEWVAHPAYHTCMDDTILCVGLPRMSP
jgi:hypothetical protein